jgi:hypothetical protein
LARRLLSHPVAGDIIDAVSELGVIFALSTPLQSADLALAIVLLLPRGRQ